VSDQRVIVGKITGAHGIRGWVKVHSFTDPMDAVLDYAGWQVQRGDKTLELDVLNSRMQGKGLAVQLKGCDDRNMAETFAGLEISVARTELAQLDTGEYYWSDLIGLTVVNQDGIELGQISSFMETGANDVLVVKAPDNDAWQQKERLLPYLPEQVVLSVDLTTKRMRVDWDPAF